MPPRADASATDAPAADVHELTDALMRAARRLRRGWHAGLEPAGLSPHQARALHVLGGSAAEGMRISDLAGALRIAPRSATEVVDGLAEKGLAERGADPADRRAVVVRLTGAGAASLAVAEQARTRAAAELFERLDDAERTELARLLRRLAD